ncbi:DUF2784 domain-containing protein [Microbulbifer yueqingensis]|uniref:DUF2784 domain-containing protein n=1 Tax=Microbulbifer yueqingensis TaxID=658219 RepID=A0A1G8Y7I8_9GAMM|nr:DUF2784 domain-containing protein [Microbulbifer yueqingensis]SDJ98693.1 Protein of Unknown function [Microbulbifer yueqingensis]
MKAEVLYALAADAILVTHVVFVAFVICGLLCIVAGKLRAWSWVRNPWFRLAHLIAIVIVVLQSWLGAICPLTIWEMALRERAGDTVYAGSFISHWLGRILYYRIPDWVFILCYTGFGALVVFCWFWVRPRPLAR